MNYILFAFDFPYCSGGWRDLVGVYDTLHEARLDASFVRKDMWHIVDVFKCKIIEEGEGNDD